MYQRIATLHPIPTRCTDVTSNPFPMYRRPYSPRYMNSCSRRLRIVFPKTSSLSSYQTTRRHTPWRAVRISNTNWNSWPERKLVAMDSPSWPLTPATVSKATTNAAYPIAPCSMQHSLPPVTTTLTASWLPVDCGASVARRYHAHPTAQREGEPPHGSIRPRRVWAK